MKTLIVIQARTGSSRLPNKVLLPLAGAPLLQRMVERVQAAEKVSDIVVATTTERSDDPIRTLCRSIGVRCFSGHPSDLLDRHLQAALHEKADAVVKIPSDCPLIDPRIIDTVLRFFTARVRPFDYVSNLHPATYPDGNDIEVMTMEALKTAWCEAEKDYEREHTTPFLWEQPERFVLGSVLCESGLDYSMEQRWTIDYPEDYSLIKRVYDELWTPGQPVFSMYDILQLISEKPEIKMLNARYIGVNWYRHYPGQLKTISAKETRQVVNS
ncbi:MAG TPA: glycosyltransferase family protein [Bacteroidota bacterium]|nr:glycosyltransferase family protein [Bacteroidota bacterium]